VKIACIGGGPAGLYLGVLVKRAAPEHEVVIHERNRPGDTFGFGVVFSDATLGQLAAADPDSHARITQAFARWDDIEIIHRGDKLRSSGHGFCGIERKQLLQILQDRARELGVVTTFEHDVRSLGELAAADVIVAADGVASWVRDERAADLKPSVDVRPNKFVWLGCTLPFDAFTFIFKATPHGLFRVHAYRFKDAAEGLQSTFIVECTADTWERTGLDRTDEDGTVTILEEVFAEELAGHRLIKNRSIWRSFPTVRCGSWRSGNVVLVGDAAHTAHFSIGSGTKLAMEDAIALRDALLATPDDIAGALAAYEAKRRPEVEALQAAAQASLAWFEHTERYVNLPMQQFVYHLLTRSLRVSHSSIARRDPGLAWGVELSLAGRVGIVPNIEETRPLRPTALPLVLPNLHLVNRVAVIPEPWGPRELRAVADDVQLVDLGGAARSGAGLVLAPLGHVRGDLQGAGGAAGDRPGPAVAGIDTDEQIVAWRRIVDFVHERSAARAGAVVAATGSPELLAARAQRVAYAGFDVLVLDVGPTGAGAAAVAVAHAAWPSDRALAIKVSAADPAAAIEAIRRTRSCRPSLCVVASAGDDHAAVLLADRIRFDLDIVTAVGLDNPASVDKDAIIASGRADLVVVDRVPFELRR
jgi:anthraniloyl-CoA monooxygenase